MENPYLPSRLFCKSTQWVDSTLSHVLTICVNVHGFGISESQTIWCFYNVPFWLFTKAVLASHCTGAVRHPPPPFWRSSVIVVPAQCTRPPSSFFAFSRPPTHLRLNVLPFFLPKARISPFKFRGNRQTSAPTSWWFEYLLVFYSVTFEKFRPNVQLCEESLLRIRDAFPGSWFLPIPDPKTAAKERGEKISCHTFFVAINFTKVKIILFLKKKI